jgi:hypothetical protein
VPPKLQLLDPKEAERSVRKDRAIRADVVMFLADLELRRARLLLERNVPLATADMVDEAEAKYDEAKQRAARMLTRSDVAPGEIRVARHTELKKELRQAEAALMSLRIAKSDAEEDNDDSFGDEEAWHLALCEVMCETITPEYKALAKLVKEDQVRASVRKAGKQTGKPALTPVPNTTSDIAKKV